MQQDKVLIFDDFRNHSSMGSTIAPAWEADDVPQRCRGGGGVWGRASITSNCFPREAHLLVLDAD